MAEFVTPEDQYFLKTFNLRINPFRLLGAEEIDLDRVLNLFVMEENKGLSCFSPVNNIIRGDYGTGKTMMLKAVQSFYYSKALMDITERGRTEYIPVFVNFATLSHLSDPDKIYSKVLKLVFYSMLNVGKEISAIVTLLRNEKVKRLRRCNPGPALRRFSKSGPWLAQWNARHS